MQNSKRVQFPVYDMFFHQTDIVVLHFEKSFATTIASFNIDTPIYMYMCYFILLAQVEKILNDFYFAGNLAVSRLRNM